VYYQIDGTDVRLAGSMHKVPAGTQIPGWVHLAAQSADDLWMESDGAAVRPHMFLPPGQFLEHIAPPAVWRGLSRLWPTNYPLGPLHSLKPWAVMFGLGVMGIDFAAGVEDLVTVQARRAGKTIRYLETPAEVPAALDELPIGTYIEAYDLMQDVELRRQHLSDLFAAWSGRSVGGVESVMTRAPLMRVTQLREALFENRNRKWIPKIIEIIKSGRNSVIFVGAGHLGGPSGLLALLEREAHRASEVRV